MVDGIGPTGAGKIGAIQSVQPTQKLTRAAAVAKLAASGAVPNPAADLAALGPTVDLAKIAEIKQAIASGSYKADPQAIADKMVALDLPASRPTPAAPAPTPTGNTGNKTGK